MSDPAEQDQFLHEMRNAVLATNRREGAPQLSPVWFLWTGDSFLISAGRHTAKAANIRRDPRVSICIDDVAGARYLVATGRAEWLDEAVERERALVLVAKYMAPEEVLPYWERVEVEEPQRLFTLTPEHYVWRGF